MRKCQKMAMKQMKTITWYFPTTGKKFEKG